jgi:predicted ribonuclease YlaK
MSAFMMSLALKPVLMTFAELVVVVVLVVVLEVESAAIDKPEIVRSARPAAVVIRNLFIVPSVDMPSA